MRRLAIGCCLISLFAGGVLVAGQCWLAAKARLAGCLIDAAYRDHLADGEIHRPWSWADTHPIARLEVPRLGVRRTVLSGASGPSLAFGPGHVDGTAAPNSPGNCVLAGHRDSWFAFLEDLQLGDRIRLTTRETTREYEIVATDVVTIWDAEIASPGGRRSLTLVTCYPFDGLTTSPWRFVVRCDPAERPAAPA